ncbi:MAG: hypothetical protein JNL88_11085 [Bacteroidia bacterium]|nr:hypothetical protein [Bacteroidia bacterium]
MTSILIFCLSPIKKPDWESVRFHHLKEWFIQEMWQGFIPAGEDAALYTPFAASMQRIAAFGSFKLPLIPLLLSFCNLLHSHPAKKLIGLSGPDACCLLLYFNLPEAGRDGPAPFNRQAAAMKLVG